jgi:glycosyltransferase involved in cell wall biosynthesis
MIPPPPRLLVFVIAYYADTTLEAVLRRMPASVLSEYDCEILVVDDASDDRTFEIGREYKRAHPEMRVTVLRNQYNQGYGGNQKVGYAYAINHGFDLVALVHGDGQYAPEALPSLLEPFREGTADVVFGSRMMTRFGALRGGMPLYKYVGNKILTTLQNALMRSSLSEFHSGYRVYSVRMLAVLPYRLNSNDFHFDTEIILQLMNARARLVERPIPTHYGSEVCRVHGLRYAVNVLRSTWANVLHNAGIFYQRRYDIRHGSPYTLKLGYPSSHTYALAAVPDGARVLDVGAGPGGIARELIRKGCDVAVVDRTAPDVPARVKVYIQDLNDDVRFPAADYDYLLLLDVIEHLHRPEQFLERLRAQLDYRPRTVILTTPNIGFFVQRIMLALGQFNYGQAGILDLTHTRLYTFRTLLQLLEDVGFRILRVRGVPAPFPKVLGNGLPGRTAVWCNQVLIRLLPKLFSYQIFIEARTTPDVDFVLRDTSDQSDTFDEKRFTVEAVALDPPGGRRPSRTIVGVLALTVAGGYSAARFYASGVLQPLQNFYGDFLAAFPSWRLATLFGRLDLYSNSLAEAWARRFGPVTPAWHYGPVMHVITVPLFACRDLQTAYVAWLCATYGFLVVNLVLLDRIFNLGSARWVALVAILNFVPLYEALTQRTIEMVELTFMLAAFLLMRARRQGGAGVAVGVAAMTKFLPLIFIPYFLLKRMWRALAASIATVAVIAIATEVVFGWRHSGILIQLREGSFLQSELNQSLSGMVIRALAWTHSSLPAPALSRAAILAGLATVSWLLWRTRRRQDAEELEWSVLIVAMVLLPPHNEQYYLLLLMFPFLTLLARRIDLAWLTVAYLLVGAPWPFRIFGAGAFARYLQLGIPFVGAAILAGLCARALWRVQTPDAKSVCP